MWHFASNTLRDGSPLPAVGQELSWIENIKLRSRGYHASERAMDALSYAPGPYVARVRLRGDVIVSADKAVGSNRIVVAGYVDATETLRTFARRCALDVIHLWDSPAVVRKYLETGENSLQDAARDAAEDATKGVSWDAAEGASWAARDAARAAAMDAAMETAIEAAWDAAWDAAWYATWTAARDAAKDWAAVRDARDAARDAQNEKLTAMLDELCPAP